MLHERKRKMAQSLRWTAMERKEGDDEKTGNQSVATTSTRIGIDVALLNRPSRAERAQGDLTCRLAMQI
jgi:hypothetical protein